MPWSRVEGAQQFHDLVAALGVEVAGGLVGQQHGGLGDDGPGDGHALLLAAGELGRACGAPSRRGPPAARRPARGRVRARLRLAAIEQRQLDVLQRRGARQQVEALEHEAQVAAAQQRALVARQRLDTGAPRNRYSPGAGRVQAAQDVHRRGLARAAGPHDGDELPGADVQGRCPSAPAVRPRRCRTPWSRRAGRISGLPAATRGAAPVGSRGSLMGRPPPSGR